MPVTAPPAARTVLTLKQPPHVPLEAELLTPDRIALLSHAEVCALPVMLGKRQYRVDDFFAVDGPGSDTLELHGDLSRVKWLGHAMTHGRLTIRGDAGMHLGAALQGGTITVHGHADAWVGAEMRGGMIHIHGAAGDQVGAAYPGSRAGMNGGTILIEGSAGSEVGMRMRRGVIAVRGRAGEFAGLQMKGGTIVLMAGAERRAGAWMVRGTLVSLAPLTLLPTFTYACTDQPTFLRLYGQHLATLGFAIPSTAMYQRYRGDTAVPGKGEILVLDPPLAG